MIYEFFTENQFYPLGDGENKEAHYKPIDMIKIFIDDKTHLVNPYQEYRERLDAQVSNGTFTQEQVLNLERNYDNFRRGQPMNIEGSILKECPLLNESDIRVLNFKQIFTLEQFVELREDVVKAIGLGFYNLQQKTKEFMDKRTSGITLARENQALKDQLAHQQEQIAQLMAMQAQQNNEALSKKSK